MPGREPGIAGESLTVTRSLCVWGVGAQRVRAYGCTSNAPTSHIVPPASGRGSRRWSVVNGSPFASTPSSLGRFERLASVEVRCEGSRNALVLRGRRCRGLPGAARRLESPSASVDAARDVGGE